MKEFYKNTIVLANVLFLKNREILSERERLLLINKARGIASDFVRNFRNTESAQKVADEIRKQSDKLKREHLCKEVIRFIVNEFFSLQDAFECIENIAIKLVKDENCQILSKIREEFKKIDNKFRLTKPEIESVFDEIAELMAQRS